MATPTLWPSALHGCDVVVGAGLALLRLWPLALRGSGQVQIQGESRKGGGARKQGEERPGMASMHVWVQTHSVPK